MLISKPQKKQILWLTFLRTRGSLKPRSQTSLEDSHRPSVLISDPEKTFLPKIEFFSSKGISIPNLTKLLSTDPNLLKTNLEKRLIPSYDFFKNLLHSEVKTFEAIKRYPDLLRRNIKTCVIPNINILRQNGVPERCIIFIIYYQPRVLTVNPVQFRDIVDEVKEMGFNPLTIIFAEAVITLLSISKLAWERKVDVFKKWGWSEDDVFLAFRRCPRFMLVSEDKIMRVMDFFINKMGMESSLIIKCPGLVTYSLEKRLIPRSLVCQVLLSKGLVKKELKMSTFIRYSERTFVQKYIMPHKEEASELLKLYKEKLDLSK
jgi:mTERF domain-containing protein